jgi:hypothetical protein
MSIDLPAAVAFLATDGRVLDRRRLELLVHGGDPTAVLAALDGYHNLDGGYGWGLEPDLRSPESQPAGAMHALEVLAEVAPTTTPRAVELCDWLAAISLPDGGLPFALPSADRAGNAPLWVEPNTPVSSLQMTTQVAGNAHLVGRHHADVAGHRLRRNGASPPSTVSTPRHTPTSCSSRSASSTLSPRKSRPRPGCSTGSASTCRPTASLLSRGVQKARRSDRSTSRSGPTARQGGCSPRQ